MKKDDTITLPRALVEQTLEALGQNEWGTAYHDLHVTTALRAALEQPVEQEPVASIYITDDGEREFDDWRHDLPVGRNYLYTHPQHLQPMPSVMMDLGWEMHGSNDPYQAWCMAVEWTERAHGIGGEA